jgi:hypothetical protein
MLESGTTEHIIYEENTDTIKQWYIENLCNRHSLTANSLELKEDRSPGAQMQRPPQ